MPTLEQRFRDWQRNRADMRLFRHLTEVHDLDDDAIDLLTELADHHRLVRASELFLRPSLMDGNPTEGSDQALDKVRRRLFGPLAAESSQAQDRDSDQADT